MVTEVPVRVHSVANTLRRPRLSPQAVLHSERWWIRMYNFQVWVKLHRKASVQKSELQLFWIFCRFAVTANEGIKVGMTHVAERVLVSIRIGHREEVEVDLVDVPVCGGVLHHLSYDIRTDCWRYPFPCVDACNEGNRYLREPEYVRNECSTWSHAKKFDTDRIRTKLSAHRARPYSCGEPSYLCYEISIAISM